MKDRTANILPPEGVPIAFLISTGGARFGAQLLDIVITFGGLLALFFALIWAGVFDWSIIATLFLLTIFFIRIPYYIFSELVWNGRTLGKRIVGIRVISSDGGRLTPHQIVARNLMKEVEVFMPLTTLMSGTIEDDWVGLAMFVWVMLVLAVPVFNKRRQRLGDMIAGTLVVDQPRSVLMPDLAVQTRMRETGFILDTAQLEIYGRFELQVLEEMLREKPRTVEARERVAEVARTIRRKIGFDEAVASHDDWEFLSDFYRQQRQYLESRQLFGDAREDKFHDKANVAGAAKPSR
ncbi:RDD family protein [Defluviimonas aestuarii]|uniref:RDD family protein n=1 Tax=Albidovulum aestuarii TaxID=1130726 RepID=UPI00249C90CF|nr:RDD family protein [Defluviimonas aestuarii]MDI3336417.1 RDD family protein [Defluviimonas aestuarii]